MALDTEGRRRSALGLFPGLASVDPVPDGSVDPQDRLHDMGLYARSLVAANWDGGSILTKVARGTELTTASLPPGNFILMAKAIDTSGNYSDLPAAVSLNVTNANDAVVSADQAAKGWPGTRQGFVKHDVSNRLVPDSLNVANTDGVFAQFVRNPVADCIYETPEIDLGFDSSNLRLWMSSGAALGPGEIAGAAQVNVYADYHLAAGAYDGFEAWTVGVISARFVKARAEIVPANGKAYLSGFTVTLDAQERTESGNSVTVSPGGTAITFAQRFNTAPNIDVTVDGTSALIPVKSAVTVTGFTIHVFNTSGTDVGGTVDWKATGV